MDNGYRGENNSNASDTPDEADDERVVTITKISAEDKNLYNGKLIPKLGENGKFVIIGISMLAIISTVFLVKYKSYKDIK